MPRQTLRGWVCEFRKSKREKINSKNSTQENDKNMN